MYYGHELYFDILPHMQDATHFMGLTTVEN